MVVVVKDSVGKLFAVVSGENGLFWFEASVNGVCGVDAVVVVCTVCSVCTEGGDGLKVG